MVTRETPLSLEPLDERAGPRLVDAFAELFAYVGLLLSGLPARQPAEAEVAGHFRLLVERSERYRDACGMPRRDWEAGFFAVCAWADERILCSAWEGRPAWLQVQLQRRRFQTTRGGELFFERLAALPPEAVQQRAVFDYCLALGFQGRYFELENRPRLRTIQAQNRALLPGPTLGGPREELFPDVGRSLAPHRPDRRFPMGALAYGLLFLVPPALFALAHWGFKAILDGLLLKFGS